MKNFLLLFLFSTLYSCSTYLKFKYRVPSDFYRAKGSKIFIANEKVKMSSKQRLVLNEIAHSLKKDGWWSVVSERPKKGEFFELKILDHSEDTGLKSSSSSTDESGVTERYATFEAIGATKVVILNSKKKEVFSFEQITAKSVSSKAQMPKPRSSSSLRPLFEAMLGIDRRQNAVDRQNNGLKVDSIEVLRKAVGEKVMSRITPNQKLASVKFLDDEDDMKPAKKFMKAGEYKSALTYLVESEKTNSRSDVLYNLGVANEALQDYSNACSYYKRAYEIDKEPQYLEQEIACLNRASFHEKIKSLSSL